MLARLQYRPCEAKPFLPFQVSVPLKRVIRPVSSNRRIKPDVRVSRIRLTCQLHIKGYETYRHGRAFRVSAVPNPKVVVDLQMLVDEFPTPPFPAET